MLQFRLQYFGSFTLLLPLCVLAQDLCSRYPTRRRWIAPSLACGVGLAYLPSLGAANAVYPAGGDFQYELLRPVYQPLHDICAKAPGIVLAEHGDGHYIRYHSDCSVMANNFILTPQHEQKIGETDVLLGGSVASLLTRAPYVRYLLVRRSDNVLLPPGQGCYPQCVENRGLTQQLLIDAPPFPPQVRLIHELWMMNGSRREPLARLFEIIKP